MNSKKLLAKLGAGAPPPAAVAAAPKAKKPTLTAPAAVAAALPNAESGVERMTISLHGTDTDRLNQIEDYLRTLGHREGNKSLLIKVALRAVDLTPALVDHLRAAQAEDGRRKKSAKAA